MEKILGPGLTFDDVLLIPAKSEVLPRQVELFTQLTQHIRMSIPLVSAAMDTVTEARMAISLAREGGIGFIHKNMSIEQQAHEIDVVKRSESGMIRNPITMESTRKISEALEIMKRYRISGIPIVDGDRLQGILTNRDLRFETNMDLPCSELMTRDNLITVPPETNLQEAEKILQKHRIEKLLVVDENQHLVGLITVKDIQNRKIHPNAAKDKEGRLLAGAAVGVASDTEPRVEAVLAAGADVIVVDTAHGHSFKVIEMVMRLRKKYSHLELIAGNVATAAAAQALVDAGASAIKVGIGPGSICTTRVVAGVGVPQITAIMDCASVCQKHRIPLIADGGIKQSGDIAKAIAAGADSVMIGNLLAGIEESPGEKIILEGRSYKVYRAMGSISAMKGGRGDRYFQEKERDTNKLVPEGIEGRVPYRGKLSDMVYQLLGGLRAAMGYCGTRTIAELKEKGQFIQITGAGLRESHPHDVIITHESPNYFGG